MINLGTRIGIIEEAMYDIQDTNSRLVKKEIIDTLPEELKPDFYFLLEVLNGQHKLGYTFVYDTKDELYNTPYLSRPLADATMTIREYMEPLFSPFRYGDLSYANIGLAQLKVRFFADFIEPIVNRTLKLGIGGSLLDTPAQAPMLAKKYGDIIPRGKVYITEKLDGNRCIASYDGNKWNFTSRNGKAMHVNFDMTGLNTTLVYDGEVLSPEQTRASILRSNGIFKNIEGTSFNYTSGLINRHTTDKKLIYNIFDIQDNKLKYEQRREILMTQEPVSEDVRILPVLYTFDTMNETQEGLYKLLDDVVKSGGEGLMINTASGLYVPKRTSDLLKLKQVQSMDMKVVETEFGTGKYEGMVGSIICTASLPNGSTISCSVGTGLSDHQRLRWALYPDEILGKIVEVEYFSLSQSKNSYGTTVYSLRFPRLKSVRKDKNETSTY